jgi:hypothetical protein
VTGSGDGVVRQVLAIVGSCVLLLVVLRLATIGGESATSFGLVRLPSPTPSPREECAAFAQVWIGLSGGGPGEVTAVSRCRRDGSGAWVPAQDAGEPRLRSAARAASINLQLARLQATLPGDLRGALADIEETVATPGIDHVPVDARTEEINRQYAWRLEAYLEDPAHRELAAYVAWIVARRDAAVAAFIHGCGSYPRMNQTCARLARSVGAGWAPWPWDLGDDLLLGEYLAQFPEEG